MPFYDPVAAEQEALEICKVSPCFPGTLPLLQNRTVHQSMRALRADRHDLLEWAQGHMRCEHLPLRHLQAL